MSRGSGPRPLGKLWDFRPDASRALNVDRVVCPGGKIYRVAHRYRKAPGTAASRRLA